MGGCSACGNANPDEARFCFACGAPLSAPTPETRKTITVLFLDLIGSTSLAERLDPESYRLVMSRFFSRMAAVVEQHGGRVEKFIGDAVVATYGLPVMREDDALRAVRTALDMRPALAGLNDELSADWGIRLAVRTGINTGEVALGAAVGGQDIGLGDASNVAARLEELAGADEILLSETTHSLVRAVVDAEQVAPLAVKGKQHPVRAYRLEALAAPPARGADTPMVGRHRELTGVLDAFEEAVARREPRLVFVSASPGLGKSRLLTSAAEELVGRGHVTVGNCMPYGSGITYAPVASVVRDLFSLSGSAVDELLAGAEHADVVRRRLEQVLGISDGNDSPDEVAWAFRRLLEEVAARHPVVVILEDLHWAEPPLLDLIEHVADWTKGVPLLLLASARPELADLGSGWSNRPRTIVLEPLDEDGSRLLARQAAGDVELSDAALGRIAEAAGGNPLYIEQMLSMLVDELGTMGARKVEPAEIPVPPTISALLAARVDTLDPAEREVLERAAVAGLEFSLAAVRELASHHSPELVTAALARLVRKDFVETARYDAPGAQTFRFRHALIREAAYAALSKAKRATLHEELAGWIEQHGDEADEIVGFHLEQSYNYKRELRIPDARLTELAARACSYLGGAGRRARARQDMRGAVTLLSRAVQLALAEDSAKARLLLELGSACVDVGDVAAAQRAFGGAAEISRRVGDTLIESEGLLSLADLLSRTDPAEATSERLFDQIEQAVQLFEQFDHWQGLAIAWNALSHIQNVRGCQTAKLHAAENALHYARLAGDADIEAWAQYGVVSGLKSGPAPLSEAVARAEQLIAWAREQGNRQLEGLTLATLGHMYAMLGNLDRARATATRARGILQDLDAQFVLAIALRAEALVELLAGDAGSARDLLARAYDLLEAMGDRTFRSSIAAVLADVHYQTGDLAEGRRCTALVRELAAGDDLDAQVGWRRVEAKLLARAGDLTAAERLGREAVALVHDTDAVYLQADALSDLAEVLIIAGRREEASALVEQALSLHATKGNVVEHAQLARRLTSDRRPATTR